MNACPHCGAELQAASYMHDPSNTVWFDAICGSCGYHTEAAPTREGRAAVAELIEAMERLTAPMPSGYRFEVVEFAPAGVTCYSSERRQALGDAIVALARVKGVQS